MSEFHIASTGFVIFQHLAFPRDPNHGQCEQVCHRYSFHDERRAFDTPIAPNTTHEALYVRMRHQSPDMT